ncbi:hypothetical protein GCM10010168_49350 [Actinoplanes ianthinogenes]|uniref:Uncharacterized protein n=1 Tax=Actinoplanes ianthinogenes TaxID=122358 RepID=A0ABN6CLP2_9ACTN|nr:hypothetical protein [Actinoplanes ianthinogenes]BCJ45987.1 hypothetical protein Aiant_66440 [Actinoplanes ianthinogenes]GGR25526.1 hypothetical protein GCM10010168_49350 [Actinoplanes ianthinogenes]
MFRTLGGAAAGLTLVAIAAAPAQAATSWAVLSTPNRGTIANELYGSAALSASAGWAVGSWYDTGLAAPRTLIERWNGTSWSTVTSPNATQYYNELRDVDATSASSAWAVGYANGSSGVNGSPRNALALRWNGTSWSTVATPQPGVNFRQLYGVKAVATNDAWAVGWYYDSSLHGEALILHWNGTAWTQVTAPDPGTSGNTLESVAGTAANDLWAVGYYSNTGEKGVLAHPLAAHWNGTAWTETELPASGTGTFLHGVTALSANDVWAVGSKNGYSAPVAYHWNGTAWSEAPTAPTGGTGNNVLYGVSGTAGNVWAVGYTSAGGRSQPLVQRWNGTAFTDETVPQQEIGGVLYSVAATSGPTVFAAGTRSDLNESGSLTDRTLSLRGTGS